MIGLRQFYMYLCVFSMVIFTVSCAEENSAADDEETGFSEEAVEGAQEIKDEVHYQVPSPHEMMDFIKLSGTDYHPEVLCPTEIHDKFVDLKGRSIGMGLYIADLAYASSFSKFQQSIKYFNVIVKMADEIGIGSVFDNAMLERIKNNLDNADSLEAITNSSYYKIISELEVSERGKVVAMIAAGGWLESIYIATKLVPKYEKGNPLIERIADQKYVYENIMAYLDKYKDDQNVEWTINDFSALETVMDEISDNSMNTKFSKSEGGKRVLGGKGGVYITEQEYAELIYKVDFLRNTLTFNSPVPQ